MEGKVGGDLVAFDQSTRVAGTVDGGIDARGETLTIKSTAQVAGPVKFEGEKEPHVEDGAKLAAGPVSFKKHQPGNRMEGGHSYYIWRLLWSSSFILYGLVLIWLMPKFAGDCVTSAENAGVSIVLGILVGISLLVASCVVCFTFVGIPLGILGLILWLVMLFSAQIVFGGLIGRWILGKTEDTWGRVGRMALGMAILGVVVPILHQIPVVEFFFKLVVMAWGFGAIVWTLYKKTVVTPSIPRPPPIAA